MNNPYTVTVTRGGAFPAEPLSWHVTADSVSEALQNARNIIAGTMDSCFQAEGESESCTCCQTRSPDEVPVAVYDSECPRCGHLARSHRGRGTP